MFLRLTPAVKNLLILNIGIFIIQAVCPAVPGAFFRDGSPMDYLDVYGALYDFSTEAFYPWQFLTHAFMHMNFHHLFSNMLLLFFMGPLLESVIGDRKFLILYLGSLLIGGVAESMVNHFVFNNAAYMLIGASGATMGVLAATALLFPDREVYIYFLFRVKLKYIAIFLILMDAFGVVGIGQSVGGASIAHMAHLGGALFGALMVLYWKNKGQLYG